MRIGPATHTLGDSITAMLFGRETWKIDELAGPLKQELFEFIMKHDGGWEGAHVPKNLVPLLV